MRPSGRAPDEMRAISIETHFTKHAEGSCLIGFGDTRVLVTASVEDRIPPWLRGKGEGWVTAEYSMLPRATHTRSQREAAKGKQGGRTIEIQRLIGRSLRSCCDMTLLGERQVIVDCDVLQADGGTRTASICGAYIALHDALTRVQQNGLINKHPLHSLCAAVSVGIHNGVPILDLPYVEDSSAEVDMNVVMLQEHGSSEAKFVEVQGTAEGAAFSQAQLTELLALATNGLREVFALQTQILSVPPTPRPK
jgi:ribonuclease PH